MKQNITLSAHVFKFKQLDNYYDGTFKIRISLNNSPIPEKKMIKGTQPLAGYSPKEFYISDLINPLSFGFKQPNIFYSVDIQKDYDPFNKEKTNQNDPVLIIELLMYGLASTSYSKKFPADEKGFSNIGHNILKVNDLTSDSHEITQVVFDEVLFCSVGIALHCQTIGLSFYDDLNNSSGAGKLTLF